MHLFTKFSYLVLLALALPLAASAQSASSYTMVASGSSATAYGLLAPTTAAATRTAGTSDEGYYNSLPIGFAFRFGGTAYTTLSASTNGFMVLGQALSNALPTNNLTSGTPRPIIAPLWDDLSFDAPAVPADPTVDGNLFYQTTGTAGSRIFTIEWRNVRWNTAATGPVFSCLVQLVEGSNTIVFDYLQGSTSASGSNRSASVGLAGATSGDFFSLADLSLAATTSTTTETTTIAGRATSGRIYTFTPATGTASRKASAVASFQLAPNPAHGLVRLVGHNAALPVLLLDSQGRIVRRLPTAADATLDLRGLATGLYLVRVGEETRRLSID